jgi:hypothetical protein
MMRWFGCEVSTLQGIQGRKDQLSQRLTILIQRVRKVSEILEVWRNRAATDLNTILSYQSWMLLSSNPALRIVNGTLNVLGMQKPYLDRAIALREAVSVVQDFAKDTRETTVPNDPSITTLGFRVIQDGDEWTLRRELQALQDLDKKVEQLSQKA